MALANCDLASYRGLEDPGIVDNTAGLALISCAVVHTNCGRSSGTHS